LSPTFIDDKEKVGKDGFTRQELVFFGGIGSYVVGIYAGRAWVGAMDTELDSGLDPDSSPAWLPH